MQKLLMTISALLCMAFSNIAFGNNAAPLGLELGSATYEQVKQQVGGKTSLEDAGINKHSGGKMLKGSGNGLGIDGLSKITLIFDASDKLAAVLMTLPKENFQQILSSLSAKYKLVSKEVPFVGDASARLQQGDSVIEIDAPHMSFEMSVNYLTKKLKQAVMQQLAKERAAKEKRQADQF